MSSDEKNKSLSLTETEAAKRRYELVQKWATELRTTSSSSKPSQNQDRQHQIDAKYEDDLRKDLNQKRQFLRASYEQAKINKTRPKSLKASIVGTLISNNKLPFKPERGDSISIAMATTTLQKQVDQSEEVVKHLIKVDYKLRQDILQYEKIKSDLQNLIPLLNQKIHSNDTEEEEKESVVEDRLTEELAKEMLRYRSLRKHLRDLIDKYEGTIEG